MKCHKFGCLNNRSVLFPSSGEQKSKVKVLSGFLLLAIRKNLFQASCPASGCLPEIFGIHLANRHITQPLSSCSRDILTMCMSVSKFPFLQGNSHIG